MGQISHCLSDLRQVAEGCKHSADHPAGAGLRWRNSPPLGRHGNPGLLQPSLWISTPGLHRVVSNWKSELKALCHTLTYDKTLSQQVTNNDDTYRNLCVYACVPLQDRTSQHLWKSLINSDISESKAISSNRLFWLTSSSIRKYI